jgi:hypothetical protein
VLREKDEYDVRAEIVGELSAALTLTNSTGTIDCSSLNCDLVNLLRLYLYAWELVSARAL